MAESTEGGRVGAAPRPVRRPTGAAAPTLSGEPAARSLLLAVLTLHVVPDGGAAWTSALVRALDRLGVPERNARQALLRLVRDRWLSPERHGRRTRLQMTDLAHAQMQRARHMARFEAAGSDEWLLLVLAEPPAHEARRRLRRVLTSFGWAPVAASVWLTNGTASQEAVAELLALDGLDRTATLVRAEFLGPLPLEELVARAWDLDLLAERYRGFLARFGDLDAPTDAEAFRARVLMTDAWIRTFRLDPFLPARLLPPDWPGHAARALLHQRQALWTEPAERWWHAAAGAAAADIPPTPYP